MCLKFVRAYRKIAIISALKIYNHNNWLFVCIYKTINTINTTLCAIENSDFINIYITIDITLPFSLKKKKKETSLNYESR